MFLQDISSIILTTLIEHKWVTTQDLFGLCSKKWAKVSLPNFYKIISKMIDEEYIVKKDNQLQLHGMRVQHTLMMAENLKTYYIWNDELHIDKLKKWETKIFEAPSLYELDIIRTDALGKLYARYAWEEAYYYNSHSYHMLSMPEKEKTNLQELWKHIKKTYFLFGNTTFLDKYWAELLAMPWYDIHCIDNPPFPEEWYCINIFGDFVVEAVFPEEVTQYYKVFFETVQDLSTFNPSLFSQILKMKCASTLKIIHSPELASKMKKKIKKYFI